MLEPAKIQEEMKIWKEKGRFGMNLNTPDKEC
jgi:hypothetical protein